MVSLLEKYKVTSFNDMIGQNSNVNFLKNSLFNNLIYPLYLFSGMRGSGKTTSARIFSLSILCENLEAFQKNSNTNIPCYKCTSCNLYKKHQHPDIIELDAASHTGIDTIRSVIDNAHILPISSKKKIYIIDEVHMLSKAAFNACLKIMEEPPENVHFILATTEIHKVIETVRSRSIILQYKPIHYDDVYTFIKKIIKVENITIDTSAIENIVELGEGSIRDTLNILNRVMLISSHITNEIIKEEYGTLEKKEIELFMHSLLENNQTQYYQQKEKLIITEHNKVKFFETASQHIQKLIHKGRESNTENSDQVKKQYHLLHFLYHYEELFFNSTSPIGIFDLFFLKNSGLKKINESNQESTIYTEKNNDPTYPLNKNTFASEKKLNQENESSNDKTKSVILNLLETVVKTIFSQGNISLSHEEKKITVHLPKNFLFYKDFLVSKEESILKSIHKAYEFISYIEYTFDLNEKNTKKYPKKEISKKEEAHIEVKKEKNNRKTIDLAKVSTFIQKVNEKFPGKTREEIE